MPFVDYRRKHYGAPKLSARERRRRGTNKLFWAVGNDFGRDFAAERALGARFAAIYLSLVDGDTMHTLPLIVGDMPRELGGLEIGFLETVALAGAKGGALAEHRALLKWSRDDTQRRQASLAGIVTGDDAGLDPRPRRR